MPDSIDILGDLISFQNDNTEKGNKDIIDYIVDFCEKNSILYELVPAADGNNFNICGGVGISELANIDKGLLLSGHIDVVPVVSSKWDTNPYEMVKKGDKLYGRGASDMKSGIAAIMSLLPKIKNTKYPVLFAFFYDEETKMMGVKEVMDFFAVKNIHPTYCLEADSTSLDVIYYSGGVMRANTLFKGKSCHGSTPEKGDNAIYRAADFVQFIRNMPSHFDNNIIVNVGMIAGGRVHNIVPDETEVAWECRMHDKSLINKVRDFVNAYADEAKGKVVCDYSEDLLPFKTAKDGFLCTTLLKILQKDEPSGTDGASEVGFLQDYGMETLICGPGNHNQAHVNNEYIEVEALKRFDALLLDLVKALQ